MEEWTRARGRIFEMVALVAVTFASACGSDASRDGATLPLDASTPVGGSSGSSSTGGTGGSTAGAGGSSGALSTGGGLATGGAGAATATGGAGNGAGAGGTPSSGGAPGTGGAPAKRCTTNQDCDAGLACYTGLSAGSANGYCVERLSTPCNPSTGGCPCLGIPVKDDHGCEGILGAYCTGTDDAAGSWYCKAPL